MAVFCENGFFFGTSHDRVVVLPDDVTQKEMAHAFLDLFSCPLDVKEDSSLFEDEFVLPFDQDLKEHTVRCGADDIVRGFHVRLRGNGLGIRVVPDPAIDALTTAESISIDAFRSEDVFTDDHRIRSTDVKVAFPWLVERVSIAPNVVVQCQHEVQMRRLVTTWQLGDVDMGGSLSSLGLAILFALSMESCAGAKTRVFVSATGAAVAGYWSLECGRFRLVDCARTSLSLFDLVPPRAFGRTVSEFPDKTTVCKGSIIEVRSISHWYIAIVTNVDWSLNTVHYVTLSDMKNQRRVSVHSRVWRFAARNDPNDLELVVRKLTRQLQWR
jgi:hypothetical protein